MAAFLLAGLAPFSGISRIPASAQVSPPQSMCTAPVEIMPLGDSITVGKNSGATPDDNDHWISYRKALWESLVASGYPVDFVGTQASGGSYPDFDPHHEGHGGWTPKQVALAIYNNGSENWLERNPPSAILLHIGTNDLVNSDPSEVRNILDEIDEYEVDTGRTVVVFLARIVNRSTLETKTKRDLTTEFNNNVEAMAQGRPDFGATLFVVDMENGAGLDYRQEPDGDMFDQLHPYATGYEKMATLWKSSLDALFQACNTEPVAAQPPDQESIEGEAISLQIEATPPEDYQVLSYSAESLPPGLSIDAQSGRIQGNLSYQASQGSPYTVRVTVRDDGVPPLSSQVTFSWRVANANLAPVLQSPGDQSNAEGDAVSLPILASDPDGDELTFEAASLPEGLGVDPQTGLISGRLTVNASNHSSHHVSVSASDGNGGVSSVAFSWTVAEVNDPPQVAAPGTQSVQEGASFELALSASDPDGDALAYRAEGLPSGLAIDPASGLIRGQLSFAANSGNPYAVTVTVTDDSALPGSASATFQINVIDRQPVFIPLGGR